MAVARRPLTGSRTFHPSYDFTEGTTGYFTTALGLFNPDRDETADVDVTLLREHGPPVAVQLEIQPLGRSTLDMEEVVGAPTCVGAVVRSDRPIAAMRQMQWDDGLFGSTLESCARGASTVHYFAEGATTIWDVFYLLTNDADAEAQVTIQAVRDVGDPIVLQTGVPPRSRRTVWVNAAPGMASTQAGAIITSALPIAAERAMYLSPGGPWPAGSSSRGAHALDQAWHFAECATAFFDCFLLLMNGDPTAQANVEVVYQLPSGQTITKDHVVPPNGRRTILVEAEDPALADTSMAMRVTSDVPIVAERAMWWGPTAASWYEAHATLGSTETGTVWGIGEAWSGGRPRRTPSCWCRTPQTCPARCW